MLIMVREVSSLSFNPLIPISIQHFPKPNSHHYHCYSSTKNQKKKSSLSICRAALTVPAKPTTPTKSSSSSRYPFSFLFFFNSKLFYCFKIKFLAFLQMGSLFVILYLHYPIKLLAFLFLFLLDFSCFYSNILVTS